MLRFAPFALLLAVAPPLLAANEKPTEAEAELITLVVKHGGTAKVQSGLDAESRVAATFNKPTEAALLAVVKQPTLGSLDLRDATKITEKAFAALSQLPNLQQLYVTGGTLTADEASAIGSLRPLQLLVLTGCKLTDAEVGKLTKLKNL
ncbi:MAG: hypothetical protein MUF18_20620, partial [Fimbriiglobus sp.]|nr:hypothetical protein [Fimbriiglobus sp.]